MKHRPRMLVVDDEQATRELVKAQFEGEYEIRGAGTGEDAVARVREWKPDVLLLDMNLPGMHGLDVLAQLRERGEAVGTTVVISGDTQVNTAVEALRRGAYDYLVKPFSFRELREVLGRAAERDALVAEAERAPRSAKPAGAFDGMLGESPAMARLKSDISKIADTRGTVLLTGESGTGKELAARAIHLMSRRAKGPYVRINCAAIPESLLEAELFGHEKGAFTNAIQRREGMFELADGGTLLLDEITEIDPSMQAKLLRVLQEREVMRLGGKATIKVDVRVIATTNRDLRTEVREGRFKEDLYYRLNVIPLHIAPLRERREDIPQLVEHFVERAAIENERDELPVTEEAMRALVAHDWPGNIRELENSLERTVILAEGETLRAMDLRLDHGAQAPGDGADLNDANLTLRDIEKELILRRLGLTGGNRTRAAEMLGISVRTLRNKINLYRAEGIEIPG